MHIDGDHAYAGVKADSEGYIPFVQAGGIVIFDDYDSDHLDVKRMVDELLSEGNFKIVSVVKEINGAYGSIALRKIS